MRTRKMRRRTIALLVGSLSLLAAGGGIAYWQFTQPQWCVRFTASGSQEVTYSRGCMNSQRYRKWVTSS